MKNGSPDLYKMLRGGGNQSAFRGIPTLLLFAAGVLATGIHCWVGDNTTVNRYVYTNCKLYNRNKLLSHIYMELVNWKLEVLWIGLAY